MRARPAVTLAVAFAAALGVASAVELATPRASLASADAGAGADASAPGTGLECVRAWGEARYAGMAYNHVVHLASTCARAARCDVSTDVNPDVQHAVVAPGAELEVTTFLGSPARAFVPRVRCELSSSTSR